MEAVQTLLSLQYDLTAIKEPRGFIRAIQFVSYHHTNNAHEHLAYSFQQLFAILAFATTSGFDTSLSYDVICTGSPSIARTYTIEYPFSKEYNIRGLNCLKDDVNHLITLSNKTSAQFYVATGVLAMLYSLAALVYYIMYSQAYKQDARIPFGDLIITVVLTFFWFMGWCAWVANKSNIASFAEDFGGKLEGQLSNNSTIVDHKTYRFAKLNVSLVSVHS